MDALDDQARGVGGPRPLRLLVAGAPPQAASALRAAGLLVEARVVTGESALEAALEGAWDCVLVGESCGELATAAVIGLVREVDAQLPVVVVAPAPPPHRVVDFIRCGASDCLALADVDLLAAVVSAEIDAAARRRLAPSDADTALRVAEALNTVTEALLGRLGSPALLQRACRVTAEVLGCDAAATLVIEGGSEVAAAASFGGSPEEREAAQVLRWPLAHLAEPLRELALQDYCERRGARLQLTDEPPDEAAALRLFTALRRGDRLIGIQVATRYGRDRAFSAGDRHIAVEISRLISLALDNARVVEDLRRAGRIKSEFVRTVSHDLRIPLTTVIGYADLLAEGAFGPLGDDQRPILRRIGDRARGLLELITATLELPGLESGRIDVDLASIDVATFVAELRGEANEWRVRRDIALEWEIAGALGSIESDRTKLHVVVKNLVVNALKFTDRGSVRVSLRERDGGIELCVADTGIGIAADRLDSIFDPFVQADASSTRRHGGVGLGLYIVRRLIDILGGTVAVESTLGSGSVFRVWHPRRAALPRS